MVKNPLTWNTYYDNFSRFHSTKKGFIEEQKSITQICTAKGLEKHFIRHLNTSADADLLKEYNKRDGLIKSYTYDLQLAFLLGLQLKDTLFEPLTKKDLEISRQTQKPKGQEDFQNIYQIPDNQYLQKLNKILTLEQTNQLKTTAYLLGQNIEHPKKTIKLITSKYDYLYNKRYQDIPSSHMSIPLEVSPIYMNSTNVKEQTQKDGTSFSMTIHKEELEDFRELLNQVRIDYIQNLTKNKNPTTLQIRQAIKQTTNFSQYLAKI